MLFSPTLPSYVDAEPAMEDLSGLIAYLESTDTCDWNLDTVRSKDGKRNCFFGHLWNWAAGLAPAYGFDADQETRNAWCRAVWDCFEENWSTTYVIYPINDGTNAKYPQETAQARVIAYLRALQDKTEMNTHESMEAQSAEYLAELEAAAASEI